MVLEYVIIGLIVLQLIISLGLAKMQAEITRSGLIEMMEEFPEAIAEALGEQMGGIQMSMDGATPIQMAIAQAIQSAFTPKNPLLEGNVIQGEDGKFVKNNQ